MHTSDTAAIYTRGRARRSIFHTAAFRGLSQAAAIGSYIVLVRGLSQHDFGVFSLLYAIIPVMSALMSLGLEQVLRRYQPEYLSSGRTVAADWLFRTVRRFRLATNLLFLLVIFMSWSIVMPLFQLEPYRTEFLMFSGVILLHFQVNLLQLALSAHMLHNYSVGILAAMSFTKLVGYSGLMMLGDLTLKTVIVTDMLAVALAFGVAHPAYRRLCKPSADADPAELDAAERKRLVRYGLYYNFNETGTLSLNSRTDNFYLAAFLSPAAVGTYAFYTRLAQMTRQLLPIRMFQNVVQPLVFAVHPDQAAKRLAAYFTLLLNSSFILQVPITAFTVAFHREIVEVAFGGRFVADATLMPVVFAFLTANIISIPVTVMAQYHEKAKIILISKAFGLLNIAALLLLIPVLGVYGAALATGVSEFGKNAFIWWHVRDSARWLNWKGALLCAFAFWTAYVLLCEQIKVHAGLPPTANLALGAVLAFGVFMGYVRSAALAPSDRRLLGSVLRGREARLLRLAGIIRPEAEA